MGMRETESGVGRVAEGTIRKRAENGKREAGGRGINEAGATVFFLWKESECSIPQGRFGVFLRNIHFQIVFVEALLPLRKLCRKCFMLSLVSTLHWLVSMISVLGSEPWIPSSALPRTWIGVFLR